jgi:formylglycine-generating enzyme
MRRSWALTWFGAIVTVFAVATASSRSQAAGRRASFPIGGAPADFDSASLFLSTASQFKFYRPFAAGRVLPSEFEMAVAAASSLPQPTAELESTCPDDMVAVEGDYCPRLVQRCLHWLDAKTMLQCAEFEKPTRADGCLGRPEHKSFCIDRYEWPNALGATPAYMATWSDARATCASAGKRLCADTEWTLACEGPDRHPYPYGTGYERDDAACNIDKPYVWPDAKRFFDPKTRDSELARLDQREPSGARSSCVSPYGVHDMVGNVDEWVVNVSQAGHPYESGLKGGYWGPVRTRCRPMTTAHNEMFRYYQIGFRCCGDPRNSPGVASIP